MPTATEPVRETREMRLISRLLAAPRKGVSLPVFIAVRREPGPNWRTWEQITIDLHQATGETITREGIRRWARKYGIPVETRPGDGTADAFRIAVRQAGISY